MSKVAQLILSFNDSVRISFFFFSMYCDPIVTGGRVTEWVNNLLIDCSKTVPSNLMIKINFVLPFTSRLEGIKNSICSRSVGLCSSTFAGYVPPRGATVGS